MSNAIARYFVKVQSATGGANVTVTVAAHIPFSIVVNRNVGSDTAPVRASLSPKPIDSNGNSVDVDVPTDGIYELLMGTPASGPLTLSFVMTANAVKVENPALGIPF